MEVKDILELARLGYKPNDIKELLAFEPKKEDPNDIDPEDDLKPGDSKPSDKKVEEDPIDAIIKRNKEEKE